LSVLIFVVLWKDVRLGEFHSAHDYKTDLTRWTIWKKRYLVMTQITLH